WSRPATLWSNCTAITRFPAPRQLQAAALPSTEPSRPPAQSMRRWRSRKALPTGLKLGSTSSPARTATSDTSGWETTFVRACACRRAGIGPWYLSFNPTLERSWHGPSVSQGVEFSPNFKFSYDVSKKIAAGLEYYGAYG